MTRNTFAYYAFSFFIGLYLANGTTVLFERELGLSYAQIFTIDALYMLMFILFTVPAGAVADLVGRKRSMYIGCAALVVAALVTSRVDTFLELFGSYFIWAFGFSFVMGSAEAMLYDTLGDEKLYQRVYGRSFFFSVLGTAASGAIGPLLYNINFRLPYSLSAIPFGLAAVALLFFLEREARHEKFSLRGNIAKIKEGGKMAFTNSYILWSMAALSLVFAVSYSFTSSYQPYLEQVGFHVTDFAYILPLMFIIEAIGGMTTEKVTAKLGETLTFWINFLILGISLVLLGIIATRAAMPLLLTYSFAAGFLRPLLSAYANRYIESSHRATVISVQGMFSTITASLLLFAFGFLADRIGVVGLAAFIGGLVLVIGTILLVLKPRPAQQA